MTQNEAKLLDHIIDLIDTDTGYLSIPIKEISYLTGADMESVVKCVNHLRTFDPLGVGAENLKQCLIIQAEKTGYDDKKLIELIKYHLQDIATKKYKKIAGELGISIQQITSYIETIQSFNPRPSRGFGNNGNHFIIPDVLVSYHHSEWIITLNDNWIGSVRINGLYKSYINSAENDDVKLYLQKKINHAKFIIKCIEQRRETLLRVSRVILDKQMEYFDDAGQLKAMSLHDVADEIGVHCSTISRTIKGKYMQTPNGTYPYKYFFVGKAGYALTEDSDAVSSVKAKSLLEKVIQEENKKKPISDNMLAKELSKQGIILSRRTVAKYREALGLPNAAERKY